MVCVGCQTRSVMAILMIDCCRKVQMTKKRVQNKKIWMQEWLKKYNFNSCWKEVYAEWRLSAPERFKGLTRYVINIKIIKFFLFIKFVDYTLNNEQFELLLARILPHIQKKDSNYRRCFPPPKRFAIFLVFSSIWIFIFKTEWWIWSRHYYSS